MIILYGIAILPVFFVYIYYLSRSVLLGWISLLAVSLYDYTFGATAFSPGGVNLNLVDIVEISLLVAGIIRTIPRLRKRDTGRTIAILYLGIFAFSLARGIVSHGFAHAANASRVLIGILLACTYFLTAPADSNSVRRYLRVYICYGAALAFVAFLANAGLHVGVVPWIESHSGELDALQEAQQGSRLLPAACALTLAFCFFLSLAYSRYRSSAVLFKWLPALFLGLAVFLRHRTVWAALAAGILSFLVVDRGLFRRLIPLAALAICIAAGYALLSRSAVPTVEDQFTDSATDERTWLWRLANWQAQLERSQTVSGALFGTPLGGEWEVFDVTTRRYENVPPHNEYLLEYLSVGVSGVVLVLCFTIRPLRRFWRLSLTDMKAVEPSASAWVAVIIAIIVYGVPYTQQVDTYALLAIANAMVSRLDKDAITATAVPSVPR